MTSLERREEALETQFAHQEELKFRARERAVKALAVWAAGKLGKVGESVDAYVREIVAADVASPSFEAAIERVATELAPKRITRGEISQMMNRFMADADAAVRSPV